MRRSSRGRRLCISLHLQSFHSADLLCDVVTTHHTEGVCVCVPHTPPTGKLVRLYLQPLLPCSCPVIGWALFRLTRLQSDRLMRRMPPHTHTLTHTLTHILFTCSGLNPGTNRCERKQRLWAGRISAADVQLPSFTLTSGRLLLLSYDDGQLVPVKSGEERDEQMCDNRRKCRFEVSNSQQQWRIQRTPEGKADSLETHLH